MNDKDRKELVVYRIYRAKETLKEIDILIDNELWNTAINRLYYACYFAVIGLLVSKEIVTQTHSGVRMMFGLHFVKTGIINKELGKFYTDIFDKRQTGDYGDFVDFSKEEVLNMIFPAKQLINSIEKILNS